MTSDQKHPKIPAFRLFLSIAVDVSVIAATVTLAYAVFVGPQHLTVAQARDTRPTRRAEPPLPGEPLSLEGAIVRGAQTARLALIEFSDFECAYCGRFARETLPVLDEKYVRTGQVLYAFRHFPLPSHKSAEKAAEAAECSGMQGRFWEMHDLLFEEPRDLGVPRIRQNAKTLRLDIGLFDQCLSGTTERKVRTDADMGNALQVTGTPTFFLGTMLADGRVKVRHRLSGAQPASAFDAVLRRLIQAIPTGGASAK